MKTAGILIIFFLFGFVEKVQSQSQWTAPPEMASVKNPVTTNQEVLKEGKKIYNIQCAMCHGNKGRGDGIAAVALNPLPANFTKDAFQAQSDGAIFWKISTGRTPMAAYKGLIGDNELWKIITYLRSFKK